MREKIIQFSMLTLYMCLLNVIFHLIGVFYFQDEYTHDVNGKLTMDAIFFVAQYSFLQTIVFPLNKRYRIIILAWIYLTLGLLWTYSGDDMAWEVMDDIIFLTSKCNFDLCLLFHSLGDDFLIDKVFLLHCNALFFFPLYLVFVGYSFRFLYKVLVNKKKNVPF